MAKVDPVRAELAKAWFDWLTAGAGVESIDLGRVQRFAWYELPARSAEPAGMRESALDAVAETFDRLGLDRYADLCRSPLTAEIHRAHAKSPHDGLRAFQDAYQRSGIDAPDLDDFAWGELFGPEEAGAFKVVERALEEAVTTGRLVPGARGWKSLAKEVTAHSLEATRSDLLGQTLRTVILTERLENWLRDAEPHSPQLHGLRSKNANRLLHPLPLPTDATERMKPVAWFLDRVASDVVLTDAGYLPTAMVREGCELFEWRLGWTDRPPRSESEISQLYELHSLLRRVGGVRRRGNMLRLTRKARQMREDPELAWRIVASGLSDKAWGSAVAEVFALLLLDGEQSDESLQNLATAILTERGWRVEGQPLKPLQVASAWWTTGRILSVLGGLVEYGDWRSRSTRLTKFGETTLLEQIRARATGPVPSR
jgi:hypothetical protein